MVTIQPFQYEKTTAFKERVQIANKVNEIISLFNELDIESKINEFNQEIVIINGKIAEIDSKIVEVNNAVNTVEGYDTRLTNVENGTVKLSGNQTIEDIKTFTKSPIVPNPPSGDTSTKAVNTNWLSQSGEERPNNLLHANGTEIIYGTQIHQSALLGTTIQLRTIDMDVTKPGNSTKYSNAILWTDENNIGLCKLWIRQQPDGRIALGIDIKKSNNTWDFGHIIYEST